MATIMSMYHHMAWIFVKLFLVCHRCDEVGGDTSYTPVSLEYPDLMLLEQCVQLFFSITTGMKMELSDFIRFTKYYYKHSYACIIRSVYTNAKQKHLGCKKVRGQSEATLQTGRRDQKV